MVERREAGGARTASAGPEHERHHRFRTDGAEKQSAGFRAAGGALLRAAHIRGFGAETPAPETLYDLFEERIAYFRDTLQKHNTAAGYQTLLHIVERFSQHRTVELFDVDGAWLGEFEEYLHARYADTSIKRFFSALKALMNYACQNGLLDANPFDRFRLSRRLTCGPPNGRSRPTNSTA